MTLVLTNVRGALPELYVLRIEGAGGGTLTADMKLTTGRRVVQLHLHDRSLTPKKHVPSNSASLQAKPAWDLK